MLLRGFRMVGLLCFKPTQLESRASMQKEGSLCYIEGSVERVPCAVERVP